MKYFATILLLLISNHLSAQTNEYLLLEGKIDKYPVVMQLFKTKNTETGGFYYTGNYWYASQEFPVAVSQEAAEDPHTLLMLTWDEDESQQEFFSGTFSGGVYKGKWTKGDKEFPFELQKTSAGNGIVYYEAKRKASLKAGDEEIAGNSSYYFYLPKDLNLQKEFMLKIDPQYSDFDSWSKMRLKEFETEYKNEVQEVMKDSPELPSFALNYEFLEDIYPFLNTENYLVMVHETYQYTGGAHGISSQEFFTYDKRQKKWLEIGDVLDLSKASEINKVLDKAVRNEHQIPAGLKLNEPENSIFLAEEIRYSENFTLSKNGITFHYGLYEMTPYVYGYFSQFVPYADLNPYLKKDFKY